MSEMAMTAGEAGYPVGYEVDPQLEGRNRLTVGFRIILAIPHAILVGGPGFTIGFPFSAFSWDDNNRGGSLLGSGGVIGIAAFVTAIISWFAILFTGRQPQGLWNFTRFYMRWRANAVAYMALLRDEYPPFSGEGYNYPIRYDSGDFPEERDRLSVGLRLIYAIPHLIVLFFLGIAWVITAIIAWFAILFTGAFPQGLYNFGVGYLRWSLRVESYVLLIRDEYPPFSFES